MPEERFPGGAAVKNLPADAGYSRDAGSISGSGRSPVRGHGNPLQYACLGHSMGGGALWAVVHPSGRKESGVTEHGYARTGTWVVAVIQTQNHPSSVLSGLMGLLLSSRHPGNKDKTAKSLGHSMSALHHN